MSDRMTMTFTHREWVLITNGLAITSALRGHDPDMQSLIDRIVGALDKDTENDRQLEHGLRRHAAYLDD